MKKIFSLLTALILAFTLSQAQTQPNLPTGAKPYSGNLFRDLSGNIWTGYAGSYTNLGTKAKVDSLLALKADATALANFYTKSQVDAFLALKADKTELNDYYTKSQTDALLAGKQAAITGAATTIVSDNLTPNRALISNGAGKVAVSVANSTELGYLLGLTGNVQTQLDGKIPLSQKGAADGVATLGSDGKIPTGQLPPLVITETYVVESQTEMLALPATQGDVAVRNDIDKSFILQNEPASVLSNWIELLSPSVVNTDQVPEGSTNLYFTQARARAALSGTSPITYNSGTGVIGFNDSGFEKTTNKVTSIGTPGNNTNYPTEAAVRAAITASAGNYVLKTGDNMTGNLTLSSTPVVIKNIGTGTGGYASDIIRINSPNNTIGIGVFGDHDNGNISYAYLSTSATNQYQNNAVRWTINNNVGIGLIGTTVPSQPLDVRGQVRFRSHVSGLLTTDAGGLISTTPASGFVTTNTEQLSLSGNKTTSGIWRFSSTPRITGNVGSAKYLGLETAGSTRWVIGANAVSESGANAGSDFVINRHNDAGAGIDNALTITRSTGLFRLPAYSGTGDRMVAAGSDGTFKVLPLPVANTAINGIQINSGVISPVYGTAVNTVAQGNDSRIVNAYQNNEVGLPPRGGNYLAVGRSISATNFDFNEITEAGHYNRLSSTLSTNAPQTGYWHIENFTYNNSNLLQVAWPYGVSNGMYMRQRHSDVWGPWVQMWHSGILRSNTENDARYLQSVPVATATVPGIVELFSNTVQSVSANAVTNTASRTYGIQLNSDGQAVVNVPWTGGTSYDNMLLTELNTGTATDARTISAKTLTDWLSAKNYIPVDANVTLLNNNAGYISVGSGSDQVRNNTDLDGRYSQFSDIPNVPSHVMDITTGDITNWNGKVTSVTGTSGINVDNTDPLNPIVKLGIDTNKFVTLATPQHITGTKTIDTLKINNVNGELRRGTNNTTMQVYFPGSVGNFNVRIGTSIGGGFSEFGVYTTGGLKISGVPYYIYSIGSGLAVTPEGVLYNTGGGGGGGSATDLSIGTRTETTVAINSSTGASATFPQATSTLAGAMSSYDFLKLNSLAQGQFLGRYSSGTGVAQAMSFGSGFSVNSSTGVVTATGASASVFTRSVDGLVPAPGGSGSTRYLNEDGTWSVPAGGGGGSVTLTGDATGTGTGTVPVTITNGAVTLSKLANLSANTFMGRLGTSGTPQALTANQVRIALSTTAANASTTIDMSGARLQRLNAISANTTYTLSNNVDGANVQATIYNSGGSTVQVNVTGAVGLGDITIPAGKAAVMSITNFGDGQVRYTIVTEI